MRAQQILTFYISGDVGEFVGFEAHIARAATKACGGCTITHGEGWSATEVTATRKTPYGKADFDDVLILSVTCEKDKVDAAYKRICSAIVTAAAGAGIDADWVHVTAVPSFARHFSIKAAQAERDEFEASMEGVL